jgi:hypothetical protein
MKFFSRLRCGSAAFVAACGLLVAAQDASASIQYDFVDYPAYENGYTLAGSLTTDGTTGAITSNDILNWSFTISQGTTQLYSLSSSSGGSLLLTSNYVYEDSTHIYLSQTSPSPSDLLFFNISGDTPLAYLNENSVLTYEGAVPSSTPYWSYSTPFTEPFTIAEAETPLTAVPEPTGAVCFIGAMGLGGVFLRRHFMKPFRADSRVSKPRVGESLPSRI